MRKASLLIGVCTALVAFMGFSSSAFALNDPACNASGGGVKPLGIYNQSITTGASTAFTPSTTSGTGEACTTQIFIGGIGGNSQFVRLDVVQPKQVYLRNTRNDPQGSYVANGCIRALTWVAGFATLFPPTGCMFVDVRVDNTSPPMTPTNPKGCPATAIACFKATALLGEGWIWVTKTNNQIPTYTLTIGEMFGTITQSNVGLTAIQSYNQCDRLGSPTGTSCGTAAAGNPVIFETGNESGANCANGNGIYTLTATQRGGATTPPATSCAPWSEAPIVKRGPDVTGGLPGTAQRTGTACLPPALTTQPC